MVCFYFNLKIIFLRKGKMGLGKHKVAHIYKYKLGSISVVSDSSDSRGEKFI